MLDFKTRFVNYQEMWFGMENVGETLDFIRLFQSNCPINKSYWYPFYTLIINLNDQLENLFSEIKKGTRYEIKRAQTSDNLRYAFWCGSDVLMVMDEFFDFYDDFSKQKGLISINREWARKYAKEGFLNISRVSDCDDRNLVWHTYYADKKRARLLHSASLFRNFNDARERQLVGRANRFHHWQDILTLKEMNYSLYDFGGWYHGEEDTAKLQINRFKEEFGGKLVQNYNCDIGLSMKGKLYLFLRNVIKHTDR
ncbi:hypothetical protein SRRS_40320 [Sporomusa rhizae]|uniref:hypothetical protein n=1 Tax=Sporomusa rhizae TaxID=357999 RepID=UPI00352BA1B7